MEEFNGQAFAASLDIELSVQVLTTGFWPQQQGNCQLPPEIVQLSETFKTFYLKVHGVSVFFFFFFLNLLVVGLEWVAVRLVGEVGEVCLPLVEGVKYLTVCAC